MYKKLFSYLSLGTLISGAILAGYALIKIWLIRASLPDGACPVVQNKPLIYIGISLCLASFVFTLLEQRAKKAKDSLPADKNV